MAIDIGINKKDRETIAKNLSKLLADTYSLYLKTHSFHWNVTGPQFNSLHLMFETQYNELWLAADEVAERIRTLDVFAPGSYSQFGKLSSIKEESGVPDWKEMVNQLVEGHEIAAATARDTLKAAKARKEIPDTARIDCAAEILEDLCFANLRRAFQSSEGSSGFDVAQLADTLSIQIGLVVAGLKAA